jgi:lysozyme
MTLSEKGKAHIKSYEGCGLKTYACSSGVATIGYGHTRGVKDGMTITQQEAEYFFDCDVKRFSDYVNESIVKKIEYDLTQEQFDALVSFAYNLGSIKDGFKAALLSNDLKEAVQKLTLYVKSGGVYNKGVHRRRIAEAVMFTGYPATEEELDIIRNSATHIWLNKYALRIMNWYDAL